MEFSDISYTTSIDFYKYALQLLDQKINDEIENNKKLQERGYNFNDRIQTDKSAILCNALDNIQFDFENDATDDIILFLIDNGAYRKKYIGDCELKDDFMTNFIYSTILKYKRK